MILNNPETPLNTSTELHPIKTNSNQKPSLRNDTSEVLTNTQINSLFIIESSPGKALGVFASQVIQRGQLIFVEEPLFRVKDPCGVPSKVKTLSPSQLNIFKSLANSYNDRQSELGIFETNAFNLDSSASAIFVVMARFNHSCSPNAKASFHPSTGKLRVFALCTIFAGEEICTSYINRNTLYGSARATRQRLLEAGWRFNCTCTCCNLIGEALKVSDRRRLRLAAIQTSLQPPSDSTNAERDLRACGRGLKLLEEEEYSMDSDDFTNYAASLCAFHQDYESSRIWSKLAYQSCGEEYGFDSDIAFMKKELMETSNYAKRGEGEYKDLSAVTKELLERSEDCVGFSSRDSIWQMLRSRALGIVGFKA